MKFTMKFLLSAFAFAFILSCSKDNDETVKVDPITGLDFTITTNEENPLQVGVTPNASGAESYKIYFDFVGAPETFETSDGTIVSYTYADETATYTVKVVASNSNGADDVELTKEYTVTVVPDTVIIDFESMNPPYFTGSKLEGYIEVVSGGVGDNSTDVGKILNDGAAYTTANITNMNYIDLTGGDKTISIDFYQETAGTPKMMLKLEGNIIEGGYDIDKVVDAQAIAGWQTIEFDMSTANNSYPNHENPTVTHSQYSNLIIFVAFEQTDYAGTYYIDNVTTGASFGDSQPDTDNDGVIDPIDECSTTAGSAELNGCPAGPSAIASVPSRAEADVLSIFSDAYTSIPIAEIRTEWSANATTSIYEITSGEDAIKGVIQADDGYAGITFASSFDMTAHPTIHMDVWSPSLSNFRMKFEDADDAIEYTVPISDTNTWVGVDIAIADFKVEKGSIPEAVNLAVFSGASAGQVFIDNIYLHNGEANVEKSDPSVLKLTLTVPEGSTAVRLTGPWWGWDTAGGPEAVDNGDNTWTFTFDPAPAENMEYLYVVDTNQESLIDNAADGNCTARIDNGSLITDYANYANRVWVLGSGNITETFDSCD
jgi:hypothetical protein